MVKHNPKSAKVNMMNAAQAEESTDVIMGNLLGNDFPAKVLFDTGASHCFISKPFASKYECDYQYLQSSLQIVSPGKQMTANFRVLDITITLGNYKFLASLLFWATRILILFSEWIGLLSTRHILIVQPGRFN